MLEDPFDEPPERPEPPEPWVRGRELPCFAFPPAVPFDSL